MKAIKGEVVPVHRKALLNALKTAAHLDPDRLDELLQAAQNSFVAMGWDTSEDLWTFGPLLEIAGRMARQNDQVDVRLPDLARKLHASKTVSPQRFGVDFEPDQSIALSMLSLAARIDRLTERESFGQTADWCRNWITDVVLSSAAHLYEALEAVDAGSSVRTDVGAEGKQMVLQAAIRESMNVLENAWRSEATAFQKMRREGSMEDLRAWLGQSPKPENRALSAILERMGEGIDTLIAHLEAVRTRVKALQQHLREGGTLEAVAPSGSSSSGKGPQVQAAESPAKVTETALERGKVAPARPVRQRFGRKI